MMAASCSQCSAPLSMESAQGRAPCPRCGAVNAAAANPYAPQAFAQIPAPALAPVPHAWICGACRHENAAHYKFCLGCGRDQSAGGEPMQAQRYGGSPAAAPVQARSSMWIVLLVVAILVGCAIVGGVVLAVTR